MRGLMRVLCLVLIRLIYVEAISPSQRTTVPVRYRLYGGTSPFTTTRNIYAQLTFAVIYHHGKYANGGHYTIDILRQDHSEWIRIDDTQIESITEADVAVLSPDKGQDKDKVAYLLFYQRIDDPVKSAQKKAMGSGSGVKQRRG